jgi:hypothetical protein
MTIIGEVLVMSAIFVGVFAAVASRAGSGALIAVSAAMLLCLLWISPVLAFPSLMFNRY